MSNTAISVENVSKCYKLGARNSSGNGLRHKLQELATAPLRMFQKSEQAKEEFNQEFWALRDVSFDIQRGEVVGIIGRNGAGKSTLLKILSRITDPTQGTIKITGRVASLLEVGTGFHPELTGRENIFLNGSILGMGQKEIRAKFDEIVNFAEIEQFIDTPVKRYSSGMYVRLAFSVAAHLEPEILIVDEVLAVGDMQFQKKCLGRMDKIAQQGGRTVLFVSHNTAAVTTLCSKAIWLVKGQVEAMGPVNEICRRYMGEFGESDSRMSLKNATQYVPGLSVSGGWLDFEGAPSAEFHIGDEIGINFELELKDNTPYAIELFLKDELGNPIGCGYSDIRSEQLFCPGTGRWTQRCVLHSTSLAEGKYVLDVQWTKPMVSPHFRVETAFVFSICATAFPGSTRRISQQGQGGAMIMNISFGSPQIG